MNKERTISEIIKLRDIFLDMEYKNKLLRWKIQNVFAWQSARIAIYNTLLNRIVPTNNYSINDRSKQKYRLILKRMFTNIILHNPYFSFAKSETLVFDSGRKYLVNGKYIDIYIEQICSELEEKNISFTRYSTSYQTDHLSPRKMKEKHLDTVYVLAKILSHYINVDHTHESELIENIEHDIHTYFNVEMNIGSILRQEIKRFKSQYLLYKILLMIKKPTSIYIVNYTDKAPLIKAAKDLDIVVNELQHGLIVKESMVANYPNVPLDSLEYFPNRYYVWEEKEMCTSVIPLSASNIIPFKNANLHHMLNMYNNYVKAQKKLLVISQPLWSQKILSYIQDNIIYLQALEVVYKIHPSEDRVIFDKSFLNDTDKYPNVKFIDNSVSIYQLLSESTHVLGIYSTSVFEAAYFGCKVLLLNLPGIEFSYSLVETGKAQIINPDSDISQYV